MGPKNSYKCDLTNSLVPLIMLSLNHQNHKQWSKWGHVHYTIIIDVDQTGFIHGRSIAENFVYAADLLSCCYKRTIPTAVLKLDFKKAFDSVE